MTRLHEQPGHKPAAQILAAHTGRAARLIGWIVTATLAGLLLQAFIFRGDAHPLVKATVVALAGLAWFRPADALMVVAALVPVADVTAALLRSPDFGPEILVLAFFTPWLLRYARQPEDRGVAARVWTPAALLGVVMAASAITTLIALQPRIDYPGPYVQSLLEQLTNRPITDHAHLPVVRLAITAMLGLALLPATATICAKNPGRIRSLTGMLVVGATAAAALNVQRLIGSALRSATPIAAFREYLGTVRVNVHYTDVNAAGSYFAALLLLALGLTITSGRRSLVWLGCAALIAAALWLTGSRAGLAAAALALAGGIAVMLVSRSQSGVLRRSVTAAVLLALLGGAALLVLRPFRYFQSDVRVALHVRGELALASVRMTARDPLFGIGIGGYSQRINEFVSPDLVALFPSAPHENAHNNFLQILAELGVVGFALFAWLLSTVFGPIVRAVRASSPTDGLLVGVVAGLVAFLLTCLVGHPLLTREVAYTFWILLGLAAANAAASHVSSLDRATLPGRVVPTHGAVFRPVAVAGIVVLLLLSIPFRARHALRNVDLEHAALGTSEWHVGADGARFRWAGSGAVFFVPAGARTFEIPLSSDDNKGPVAVEIRLDGRLADKVLLGPGEWRLVKLLLPSSRSRSRFRSVKLFISHAPTGERSNSAAQEVAQAPRIKVGKIVTRW